MEFIGWLPITLISMCLISMIMYHLEKKAMQRTIDRLTDKIMSKDYGEYKRNNHITIDDSKPQRKPISFYDDPSIEIEEDSMN